MRIKKHKYLQGISLIEAIISISIILFILTAFSLLISSTIINNTLADKKVELIDTLDQRIEDYSMLGSFDTTSSGSITFSQSDVNENPNLIRFEASNTAFDISISKETTRANHD
ncbi:MULTISPECIES: hypothetical protein [Francisella]|uniref:Type II secretion system protein n=1 Tax=Francisella opportunistica TaxID=2016517 RepID=A0A345JSQ5_9GAMM|nr:MULTISPECIES: hypothetical protein [Francisella]AXH30351.1 hypothetical protein CGC43_07035 [Francisella opportunistica]AXH31992.1 hypothetical protein CGC44_07015 [Francisella opportunistica]